MLTFHPVVIKTSNVAKELIAFAKANDVPLQEIDFKILYIHTYTRLKDAEAVLVSPQEYTTLEKKAFCINPERSFLQTYEIELYPLDHNKPLSNIDVSIGVNEAFTHVYATIKKGSKLRYYKGLEEDLVRYIQKRKLRVNIFISVWHSSLLHGVKKLCSIIKVNEDYTFSEDYTFLVSEGFEASKSVQARIEYLFENKSKEDAQGRVDHAKQGYIKAVKEGEVIIRVHKAQLGSFGRDCRGKLIEFEALSENELESFKVSDNIVTKEKKESTEYVAKRNGYIVHHEETYDIQSDVSIKKISLRHTGHIDAGLHKEVNVSVKGHSVLEEAIEAGMKVRAKEIKVEGFIGADVSLEALNICIKGQTHHSAFLQAHTLEVNRHKGEAVAQYAHIELLEGGIIEAKEVYVKECVGGVIRAQKVMIETLGSNNKIFVSKHIEIQHIKGEENLLCIDMNALNLKEQSSKQYGVWLQKKLPILQQMKQEQESLYQALEQFQSVMAQVKQMQNLSSNAKKQLYLYQKLQKKLDSCEREIIYLQTQIETNEMIKESMQGSIYDARIIAHAAYKGYNKIAFILQAPKDKEVFVTATTKQKKSLYYLKPIVDKIVLDEVMVEHTP